MNCVVLERGPGPHELCCVSKEAQIHMNCVVLERGPDSHDVYCVTDRPGECPPSEVGIAIHECDDDFECENPKKCCSIGAGQVCVDPVFGELK